MKKFFAILLALTMMLSMVAMAAETTGTITITNASQSKTYAVYKVFDAHYNADTKTTSYTVKDGAVKDVIDPAIFNVDTVADSQGNYAVSVKEGVSDETVLNWVKDNADKFEKVAEKTATSNTVVFDVAYGYYYITSSLGTTVTVNTNTPEVNVIDKNTTEPSIPEDPEELKTASVATAKVGDTVNYTVSFTATNYVTKNNATTQVTQYVVEDTPSDLDIDTANIVIKAGETTVTNATITEDTATGKVTITIPWVKDGNVSVYDSPIDVTITYPAVVKAAAADGSANNSVVVKWNDTQFGEDVEELKTFKITVNKVDDKGAQLTGAEFELYDASTGGNKIALVKDGEFYRPATAEEQAADGFKSAVIEAGAVEIKGLDGTKTYYLEEIKAPEGYNKLTARVAVNFGEEANLADATSNVVNNAGSSLPSTGGMGTTLFYVVGSLMMAAAVVVLVAKKKVAAK